MDVDRRKQYFLYCSVCVRVCGRLARFGKCDQPHSYIAFTSLTALPILFIKCWKVLYTC